MGLKRGRGKGREDRGEREKRGKRDEEIVGRRKGDKRVILRVGYIKRINWSGLKEDLECRKN
mgnify:CR=1 FL=1